MRITAPSALIVVLALLPAAGAQTEPPYYARLAKLATYISAGDTVGALETFDKNMKDYGTIAQDLAALSAQTQVLCSIDVVNDRESASEASDVHHLVLDWYMTLTSREDEGLAQSRRIQVAVTMQRFREKSRKDAWRITSLDPLKILAPIAIH